MNSLHSASHWEADSLFTWYDNEPSLRVLIVTGAGKKAFCAGQDLIEQAKFRKDPETPVLYPFFIYLRGILCFGVGGGLVCFYVLSYRTCGCGILVH